MGKNSKIEKNPFCGGRMTKLSACIVVYNHAAEALEAAASVLLHTRKYPLTLLLVDNASPDGAGETLRRAVENKTLPVGQGQEVHLICSKTNVGFGSGHNLILKKLASDYHFILNPDILLTEDTLSGMADWMDAHPAAVMARPALVFPDGQPQQLPLQKCSACALVYRQMPRLKVLKRFNDRYVMAKADLTVPTEIEFCTGSFSMIRTSVFQKIGGFDEKYFMYVEDADLTQKARKEGKAMLLPQFTAIHAWHRQPHTDASHFRLQLKSMLRYFSKWGFRL
jgi:GT2 family glycosyltransferase